MFGKFDPATLEAGLQVMFYGLAGVFTVLILFYLVTKGLFVLADHLPNKGEE